MGDRKAETQGEPDTSRQITRDNEPTDHARCGVVHDLQDAAQREEVLRLDEDHAVQSDPKPSFEEVFAPTLGQTDSEATPEEP